MAVNLNSLIEFHVIPETVDLFIRFHYSFKCIYLLNRCSHNPSSDNINGLQTQ